MADSGFASREEHAVWEEYFNGRDYDPQCDGVAGKFVPLFEHCVSGTGSAEFNAANGSITINGWKRTQRRSNGSCDLLLCCVQPR